MKQITKQATLFFVLPLMLVISGCASTLESLASPSSDKPHFYALSSLSPSNNNNQKLRIGVGPLEIPRLLNRPQIISRKNSAEVVMSEQHQWGGSYKEELIQTLTDNLSSLLKTENIERYPWKFAFKPAYQVRIDIERFDGQIGKSVTLKARWRLLKNNKEILVKRAVINTPVKGKSYTDYIKAHSQTLATFSRQIAQQIR